MSEQSQHSPFKNAALFIPQSVPSRTSSVASSGLERYEDDRRIQSEGRLTEPILRSAVLNRSIFNPDDPQVKHDIIQTIIQYLQDEGYHGSSMVVQDETNVKMRNAANKNSQLRRMKRAIIDGDWQEVERLLSRTTFKNQKAFRYAIYRQQYLELIEIQQTQKAFAILQHRLKELEAYARSHDEFRDLCYLITCKSVAEAASFREWEDVPTSRSALVAQYSRLLDVDAVHRDSFRPSLFNGKGVQGSREIPPGRLVHLLHQALAFQIASSKHVSKAPPRIGSLLEDYECPAVPNQKKTTFTGHTGNIKSVVFVGDEGCTLASGSSDNTTRIWNTNTGKCKAILHGHSSRIWDVSSTRNGTLIATASGDATIRLWNTSRLLENSTDPLRFDSDTNVNLNGSNYTSFGSNSILNGSDIGHLPSTSTIFNSHTNGSMSSTSMMGNNDLCKAVLREHSSDIYAVRFHPLGNSLVSGGYDRLVKLYDVETQTVIGTFEGHRSSISSISFNARGNMIITGSKDSTIRFWDIISGLCIKTISSHLGEVTSVETNRSGNLMLSSSKDNSNRLWDIRMHKAVRRFKGHQNTSKNLIRASFGPNEMFVTSGSEDGFAYVWDVDTTDVVTKLGPTIGTVYGVVWNGRQSLLASYSHDGIVSTWGYEEEAEST